MDIIHMFYLEELLNFQNILHLVWLFSSRMKFEKKVMEAHNKLVGFNSLSR